jgi:hypothetical protein
VSHALSASLDWEGADHVGLFDPGNLPKPSMETFTKDMESWERTTPSVKTFEKNTDQL